MIWHQFLRFGVLTQLPRKAFCPEVCVPLQHPQVYKFFYYWCFFSASTEGARAARRHLSLPSSCLVLMRLMRLEAIYQAPQTSQPYPGYLIYPHRFKGLNYECSSKHCPIFNQITTCLIFK